MITYFCTNCISDVNLVEHGITHKCECYKQPSWHEPHKHWISYKLKEKAIDNILIAYGYDPDEVGARMRFAAEEAIAKVGQFLQEGESQDLLREALGTYDGPALPLAPEKKLPLRQKPKKRLIT